MANPTTNLNITLPVPESELSRGNWGDTINAALQSLDTGIADRGVPSGGTGAQVLTKSGSTDYATEWADKSAVLSFLNAEDGATADQSAAEVRTLVADASDSNVYTDSEKTKLADVNTADLAITAANDANITTVAGQITPTNNISTVAGSIGNINLIGDDLTTGTFSNIFECGNVADVVSGTVGTSDIATVAGSIADINRYAAEYIISDDVPTSPTPTAGDLWYDGTNNTLKFHNGTGFVAASEGDISAVTAGTGLSGGGTAGSVTVNIDTGTTVDKTTAQTLSAKTLTSPVINTGVSGSAILDSDTMSGASASTLSSSESIKAYVDTTVAATNEVVEDTTPQLGGDLDLNNSDITGTGAWLGTTIAVNKGGTGVTTKTGTGNVVLATSPTLVTPDLGTPSSMILDFGSI